MHRWTFVALVAGALTMTILAGCEHDCRYDAVCGEFEAAAEERADDCGYGGSEYILIFDCPYTAGPGSEIVCGSVYACVDALDNDQVDCDGLSGLSLASCSTYTD